jgi:hypothetical protein
MSTYDMSNSLGLKQVPMPELTVCLGVIFLLVATLFVILTACPFDLTRYCNREKLFSTFLNCPGVVSPSNKKSNSCPSSSTKARSWTFAKYLPFVPHTAAPNSLFKTAGALPWLDQAFLRICTI